MNISEMLTRLDRLFSLGAAGIQAELDDLVAKYGHGVVTSVRYVPPGAPSAASKGITRLTLSNGDQEIVLEITLVPVASMVLNMLLQRF